MQMVVFMHELGVGRQRSGCRKLHPNCSNRLLILVMDGAAARKCISCYTARPTLYSR
jgi:hypothetical protein